MIDALGVLLGVCDELPVLVGVCDELPVLVGVCVSEDVGVDTGVTDSVAHSVGVGPPAAAAEGMEVRSPAPSAQNMRHRCASPRPEAGMGADTTDVPDAHPPAAPVFVSTLPKAASRPEEITQPVTPFTVAWYVIKDAPAPEKSAAVSGPTTTAPAALT